MLINVTQVLKNVKCKELDKQIILWLCQKRDSFGIKQGLILAFLFDTHELFGYL